MKKLILVVIAVLVYQFIFSQEVVTDIDGYTYHTVQIGNQTWLKENLRVTKYNDGTPINARLDNTIEVGVLDQYTYYDFDLNLERVYGKLYNGFVVRNEKNVCPCGWKIPTDAELTELVLQADPNAITDTLLWGTQSIGQSKLISDFPVDQGGGGTNETGFSLLMAGAVKMYDEGIEFMARNIWTLIWSTTPAHDNEEDRNYTRSVCISGIERFKTHVIVGAPIRCIKDAAYDCQTSNTEEIKIEYSVYPNPVIDQLNVVVDPSSVGEEYTIIDMNGKILIKDKITSQEFQIDMSGLSSGTYIVNINQKIKKIIK
jgi:uncharacterized protein (TIGR02145 family)